MKKYLGAALLLLICAASFTGAACAADGANAPANPFMDVPVGHWAYDAVGQLAAKGIFSGYPDGVFKGRQPVTRYEMASALARALADFDASLADAADLETIVKLGTEFEDEFYALDARVGELYERAALFDERLNNWRISGSLLMDLDSWDSADPNADLFLSQARLYFDRWFGENGDMYFHAGIDSSNVWQAFYVEFPAWFGSMMTVGRFEWDFEAPYNFNTGGVSDLGVGSFLTDRTFDGWGFTKSFAIGSFQTYIHRIDAWDFVYYEDPILDLTGLDAAYDAMEAAAMFRLQFSENFGVDLGVQYFWGDDGAAWSSPAGYVTFNPVFDGDGNILSYTGPTPKTEGFYQFKFNDLYTFFGGLRFEFTENIGLRGIYYYQSGVDDDYSDDGGATWQPADIDDTSAYRLALDVKQELLGFTSLWLGYDFIEGDFWTFSGQGEFVIPVRVFGYDLQSWRVGATQQWSDRWRTWEYFAYHSIEDAAEGGADITGNQFGVGVEYRLNESVAFALNYVKSNFDDIDVNSPGDDHLFRFRTRVDF